MMKFTVLALVLMTAPAFADPTAIARAYRALGFVAVNERDLAHSTAGELGASLMNQARACGAEVRARLDAGEPRDTPVAVTGFDGTAASIALGDADLRVCATLWAKGAIWDGAVASAHATAAVR
jgi:hypothetical protein